MAKSKHRPRRPQKPLTYDPRETDAALSEDLRQVLKANLSLAQLIELEKQLRRSMETALTKAVDETGREAYMRCFSTIFRVLVDRYGFGKKRLRDLYDGCLEYLQDIADGRITTQEMVDCLRNSDKIDLVWE